MKINNFCFLSLIFGLVFLNSQPTKTAVDKTKQLEELITAAAECNLSKSQELSNFFSENYPFSAQLAEVVFKKSLIHQNLSLFTVEISLIKNKETIKEIVMKNLKKFKTLSNSKPTEHEDFENEIDQILKVQDNFIKIITLPLFKSIKKESKDSAERKGSWAKKISTYVYTSEASNFFNSAAWLELLEQNPVASLTALELLHASFKSLMNIDQRAPVTNDRINDECTIISAGLGCRTLRMLDLQFKKNDLKRLTKIIKILLPKKVETIHLTKFIDAQDVKNTFNELKIMLNEAHNNHTQAQSGTLSFLMNRLSQPLTSGEQLHEFYNDLIPKKLQLLEERIPIFKK